LTAGEQNAGKTEKTKKKTGGGINERESSGGLEQQNENKAGILDRLWKIPSRLMGRSCTLGIRGTAVGEEEESDRKVRDVPGEKRR